MVPLEILWRHPGQVFSGLPYSLTLLTILLAHEMGHYLACMYYRVDASLPYFIPSPVFGGTFGAFIRIRSAICSRRQLFDIGIAGPLAGFLFLVPALAIGLAFSKVMPGFEQQSSLQFGIPRLQWLLEWAIFPGVNPADICLHPVARAAWIGMLATALNLLPAGQLDGGHILYALFSERHKLASRLCVAAMVPLGLLWRPWLLWALVLFWLGRRHPMVYDTSDVGVVRQRLGLLAVVIFALCFMPSPMTGGGF
jgi:membrane-associated protease RseP (regulator of RpoE activity)